MAVRRSAPIHGGKGICLGPLNYLGRGYESAPIAITVEGANILTRNLIIFGQGAMRCHPYIYKEIKAAQLTNVDESRFSGVGDNKLVIKAIPTPETSFARKGSVGNDSVPLMYLDKSAKLRKGAEEVSNL